MIGRFVEIVQELALMANFQETWNRVQNLLCSIRLLWIGGKQSIKGRAVLIYISMESRPPKFGLILLKVCDCLCSISPVLHRMLSQNSINHCSSKCRSRTFPTILLRECWDKQSPFHPHWGSQVVYRHRVLDSSFVDLSSGAKE